MGLRRWLTRLLRRFRGEAPPVEGSAASDEEDRAIPEEADATVAVSYDPDEIERQADTLAELGLQPEEFVIQLLERADGRLRQQAFTNYTDWSEATVSRVLSEMEADGYITRISVGQENIVCLPDHVPDPTRSPSADGSDDPKSA